MDKELLNEIAEEILITREIGFDEIINTSFHPDGTFYITYTNNKLVEKHNAELQKKYIDKLVNSNWFNRLFVTKPFEASFLTKDCYKTDNEFFLKVESGELILMLFKKLKEHEHK